MTLKDDFKAALKRYVERQWDWNKADEIAEVTSWDEQTGWGGGCDTCGYGSDEDRIEIYYRLADGTTGTYTKYTSFGDLLSDLLAE